MLTIEDIIYFYPSVKKEIKQYSKEQIKEVVIKLGYLQIKNLQEKQVKNICLFLKKHADIKQRMLYFFFLTANNQIKEDSPREDYINQYVIFKYFGKEIDQISFLIKTGLIQEELTSVLNDIPEEIMKILRNNLPWENEE